MRWLYLNVMPASVCLAWTPAEWRRAGVDYADFPNIGARTANHPDPDTNEARIVVALAAGAVQLGDSVVRPLLVHEAVNAKQYVEQKMRELDGFGAETEAYLVQAIYQFLNSEFERRRKVST